MASTRILNYLENKTILVTGSTGFLGKIFVEKVLRAQPNVNKLFLLIRSSPDKSIQERLHDEVIGKDLFNVLREKHGDGFDDFISEKVCAVSGDVANEDLGIIDASLMDLIFRQTDAIVNVAATTKFDETYDVALNVNTLGAKHVLAFSKKCARLGVLFHVSTAYVAGEKCGIISEKAFQMGKALNGGPDLDIGAEVKLASETLKEARCSGVTKAAERIAMKKLGIERARKYGWPNTYVFTKAMGEMILGQSKDDLPVVIMRPTIITSTLKEPFPGWVEGNRTIDSFITAYAKGDLSFILGDSELIMDVIPGDKVVNAMLGIMTFHPDRQSEYIYHVGSSSRNPVNYAVLNECGSRYICSIRGLKWNKNTGPTFYTTKDGFDFRMKLSYSFPLQVLHLVDIALFGIFREKYNDLNKRYNYMMRLADLYKPFTLFKGIFDDQNLKRLSMSIPNDCRQENIFDFDTKNINWDEYFLNIHVPSVVKNMDK